MASWPYGSRLWAQPSLMASLPLGSTFPHGLIASGLNLPSWPHGSFMASLPLGSTPAVGWVTALVGHRLGRSSPRSVTGGSPPRWLIGGGSPPRWGCVEWLPTTGCTSLGLRLLGAERGLRRLGLKGGCASLTLRRSAPHNRLNCAASLSLPTTSLPTTGCITVAPHLALNHCRSPQRAALRCMTAF